MDSNKYANDSCKNLCNFCVPGLTVFGFKNVRTSKPKQTVKSYIVATVALNHKW